MSVYVDLGQPVSFTHHYHLFQCQFRWHLVLDPMRKQQAKNLEQPLFCNCRNLATQKMKISTLRFRMMRRRRMEVILGREIILLKRMLFIMLRLRLGRRLCNYIPIIPLSVVPELFFFPGNSFIRKYSMFKLVSYIRQ
ncbi:hypothetical protein BGX38DRAFT_347858 [Terfezia claveryi]|nr:hypothetical protein BGX38DRAFT_347858 [Terfezia claveryi]